MLECYILDNWYVRLNICKFLISITAGGAMMAIVPVIIVIVIGMITQGSVTAADFIPEK